jgi:hypothetical protein
MGNIPILEDFGVKYCNNYISNTMKKINFKSIITMVLGAALSLAFVAQAHAMTPTVSLVNNGYGTIQATVYGDTNNHVI